MDSSIENPILENWMKEWLKLGRPAPNLDEYRRDIAVSEPLFKKGTMSVLVESNGRQRFEVRMTGDQLLQRRFRKRRIAKKYMRQQLDRIKLTVFKGCFPTSVRAAEGEPSAHDLQFEYTESVVLDVKFDFEGALALG